MSVLQSRLDTLIGASFKFNESPSRRPMRRLEQRPVDETRPTVWTLSNSRGGYRGDADGGGWWRRRRRRRLGADVQRLGGADADPVRGVVLDERTAEAHAALKVGRRHPRQRQRRLLVGRTVRRRVLQKILEKSFCVKYLFLSFYRLGAVSVAVDGNASFR